MPLLKTEQKVSRTKKIVNNIIDVVCDYYKVKEKDLYGKCRKREIVKARWLAMYLIRQKTQYKLTAIGKHFDRDHSTVIHAIANVNNALKMKFETDISEDLKKIQSFL